MSRRYSTELIATIEQLVNQGMNCREISEKLGVDKKLVNNIMVYYGFSTQKVYKVKDFKGWDFVWMNMEGV